MKKEMELEELTTHFFHSDELYNLLRFGVRRDTLEDRSRMLFALDELTRSGKLPQGLQVLAECAFQDVGFLEWNRICCVVRNIADVLKVSREEGIKLREAWKSSRVVDLVARVGLLLSFATHKTRIAEHAKVAVLDLDRNTGEIATFEKPQGPEDGVADLHAAIDVQDLFLSLQLARWLAFEHEDELVDFFECNFAADHAFVRDSLKLKRLFRNSATSHWTAMYLSLVFFLVKRPEPLTLDLGAISSDNTPETPWRTSMFVSSLEGQTMDKMFETRSFCAVYSEHLDRRTHRGLRRFEDEVMEQLEGCFADAKIPERLRIDLWRSHTPWMAELENSSMAFYLDSSVPVCPRAPGFEDPFEESCRRIMFELEEALGDPELVHSAVLASQNYFKEEKEEENEDEIKEFQTKTSNPADESKEPKEPQQEKKRLLSDYFYVPSQDSNSKRLKISESQAGGKKEEEEERKDPLGTQELERVILKGPYRPDRRDFVYVPKCKKMRWVVRGPLAFDVVVPILQRARQFAEYAGLDQLDLGQFVVAKGTSKWIACTPHDHVSRSLVQRLAAEGKGELYMMHPKFAGGSVVPLSVSLENSQSQEEIFGWLETQAGGLIRMTALLLALGGGPIALSDILMLSRDPNRWWLVDRGGLGDAPPKPGTWLWDAIFAASPLEQGGAARQAFARFTDMYQRQIREILTDVLAAFVDAQSRQRLEHLLALPFLPTLSLPLSFALPFAPSVQISF